MNCNIINNSIVNKIFRRINLKEEFLQNLLFENNYIKLLHKFEVFQSIIEGVYGITSNDIDQIQIDIVRKHITEIKQFYNNISQELNELLQFIDNWNIDQLIGYFINNLFICKELILNTFREFEEEITAYTQFIYDIKLISQINDHIEYLKSHYVSIYLMNSENLLKSITKNSLKDYLKNLLNLSITRLDEKAAHFNEIFPEFEIIKKNNIYFCTNYFDFSYFYNLPTLIYHK